jgi:hypothetical protein
LFQEINCPITVGHQRASGLRFADPRVHALLHALILFRQLPQGFRASDLRQHLAALLGCHAQAISQGAVTYQLRRLRLHRLIQRVPKSFRYEVTNFGFRVALFFTRLYNRLLRPGIAAFLPELHTMSTALKGAFDALTARIDAIMNDASFTPQNFVWLLRAPLGSSLSSRLVRGALRAPMIRLSFWLRTACSHLMHSSTAWGS